jgi:hypothetical protein
MKKLILIIIVITTSSFCFCQDTLSVEELNEIHLKNIEQKYQAIEDSWQTRIDNYEIREDYYEHALSEQTAIFSLIVTIISTSKFNWLGMV